MSVKKSFRGKKRGQGRNYKIIISTRKKNCELIKNKKTKNVMGVIPFDANTLNKLLKSTALTFKRSERSLRLKESGEGCNYKSIIYIGKKNRKLIKYKINVVGVILFGNGT